MAETSVSMRAVEVEFFTPPGGERVGARFRRALFGATTPAGTRVKALAGIDLEVAKGDRLGVIGLNGAGKSTLLKAMAGIYPPTAGRVEVVGHVCPMFELATGFEMNLCGRENIVIRGLLLGMERGEIEEKMASIIDFTELGEFIDRPVRTYSSGMFIRLAFAISTACNPEILLLDEVVGSGDIKFARKARERMRRFIEEGKIVVFASHSLEMLEEVCTTALWLEKGRVRMLGPVKDVIDRYRAAA